MGCCFSNDEDKNDETSNEQNQPLLDPTNGGGAHGGQHRHYDSNSETTQQKGDEQSALNRILHQTASNVIDVAALETHNMEQTEYADRARIYSNRLQTQGVSGLNHPDPRLPIGVAAPQVVLTTQPVSLADIQMINNAAQQTVKSLRDVKVKHKEDLVVAFGVP